MSCWFERAIRFKPDDAIVRVIYALYSYELGDKEESLEALESAAKLGEDSANFHYNVALVYADLGKYDSALTHAHRAYALGFPLQGLKKKLQDAGQWKELSEPKQKDVATPEVKPLPETIASPLEAQFSPDAKPAP